jgi:hypothetical protein
MGKGKKQVSANVFRKLNVDINSKIPKDVCTEICDDISSILDRRIIPFGSTGLKDFSGDIDCIVECKNQDELWDQVVNSFEISHRSGKYIFILYRHPEAGFIQVDLVASREPQNDAWCLAGGLPNGTKGRYRNILLGYLANIKSKNTGTKITFASPGGLGEQKNKSKARITNPRLILDELGLACTIDQGRSLEGIIDWMIDNNEEQMLNGFDDYLRNPRDHMPDITEEVIKYINSRI